MSPALQITSDIVLRSALLVLFLGSLFTLAFGVSLMLGHGWVLRLNERTKRWISTREAMRPMDMPRSIESWLHRWHLPVGIALVLGSAFIGYAAFFRYDLKAIVQLFRTRASVWVGLLVQAGWWLVIVAALAGIAVGVLLIAKPALLQSTEAWANRAYSGRRATKPLETMNYSPDQWIIASPRLSGALIAAGSVYVALMLGYLLISKL